MTAVGLPAAYVPLPIGNGEQELIARPVVEAGGGLLVDDADCTADWVRGVLAAAAERPRPADRHGCRGGQVRPARRRRAAGRHGAGSDGGTARATVRGHRDDESSRPGAGRTARPRALHRHRRRGHVGDRAHHAGSRSAGVGQRRQGHGDAHRAARPRRDDRRRARRRAGRRRGHRGHLDGDPEQQSRARRGAAPGSARHPSGGRPGVGHARSPGRRRGRHARQDDDDLAADRRHPALRCRPVVRDRRQPQRVGRQRAQRFGRRLHRGGRRERRVVPALLHRPRPS